MGGVCRIHTELEKVDAFLLEVDSIGLHVFVRAQVHHRFHAHFLHAKRQMAGKGGREEGGGGREEMGKRGTAVKGVLQICVICVAKQYTAKPHATHAHGPPKHECTNIKQPSCTETERRKLLGMHNVRVKC